MRIEEARESGFEIDSCGIGFVADRRGRRRHRIVELGLEALANLAHRGGVGADGESGDGAGLLTQLPRRLFLDHLAAKGIGPVAAERLAVGAFFLPSGRRRRALAREAIETLATEAGLRLLGWRRVPMDPGALGPMARLRRPEVRQLLVEGPVAASSESLERCLYLLRRRIERWAVEERSKTYPVSFSHRTMVYKGMALPHRLAELYPDLADPRYESAVALFHLRFSTNTRPAWRLAQPFRMLAHNGEINTIEGNANWMRARERELASPLWREELRDLLPVLDDRGSDSAKLDNALELLVRSGRAPEHALMMLIPEAPDRRRPDDLQAFFDFHSTLLEPWDGPAAVVACDGRQAIAALDRNGLRPLRFTLTDELVVVGSESGIVELPGDSIERRDRLGPGQMLSLDLEHGALSFDTDVKRRWATHRPWRRWLSANLIELPPSADELPEVLDEPSLLRRQRAFGYSQEVLERILDPMLAEGKLPIASMGDDTPPALLSRQPQLLYRYFKQRFAQVTNPAIDALRERNAFSLETMAGAWTGLLAERAEAARQVRCPSPVLAAGQLHWLCEGQTVVPSATVEACFDAESSAAGLEAGIDDLCRAAEAAVDAGAELLVLTDRFDDATRAPIPMLLAVSAVHHHLIRQRKRMQVSLIADSGEPREDHHVACLIGFGATLVHPWLALQTVASRARSRGLEPSAAQRRFLSCLEEGLLKVMAKQGVCALSSYQGAQLFEALGIDAELVARHFPGTPNRIGGVGLGRIAEHAVLRHRNGREPVDLTDRGLFHFRREGEQHALRPAVVRTLHKAVRSGDREAFDAYLAEVAGGPPGSLRELCEWGATGSALPLAEVEPATALFRRFSTAAMSHGAISRETHEALAVAMNRIGGRSNSGEGGELPVRRKPYAENDPAGFVGPWRPAAGDLANSAIKQIASGRFGVTARYLRSASEIEIKISQGSKPGEGGQIPGHKVTPELAALRRATPGLPLISPPPHHDIYSIEDLAQLIFDVRRVHPAARVGVKLVSSVGIGTIAAGVVKAGADVVLIAGDSGGTGASPLSSIRHAGLPWELGLADAHDVLLASGLRGRVRLRVDGGLRSGRDLIFATLLGADEFGFGTVPLIAAGCVMARQCHLDTCPVGIASQRRELRERFRGTPEHIVALFAFLAEEVRHHLATAGVSQLSQLVGRRDLLRPKKGSEDEARGLLATFTAGSQRRRSPVAPVRRLPPPGLDETIWSELGPAALAGEPVQRRFAVTNRDRSVGTRLAGELAARPSDGPAPRVEIQLDGSAGQSLGAFLVAGMRIVLDGDAQDAVGKGMSGGEIVLRLPPMATAAGGIGVVAGNAVLYGATGGNLFASGRVGERFAVRNSGAVAVVEGCGDHGCEYMTAGEVVVLGPTGRNFGAGMSGGRVWVWDPHERLGERLNPGMIEVLRSWERGDEDRLIELLDRHRRRTGSRCAEALLADWSSARLAFRLVVPRGREPAETEDRFLANGG